MDLKLVENGNGGDLVFKGGDIQLTSEVYNQPYLARFGGNTENSTSDEFATGEQRGDYWANELFLAGKENEQLNSKFQKSLNEIELSSSGRIKLQNIAKQDLNYMNGFSNKETTLIISGVDRVQLTDKINQGYNDAFSYIWTEAKDEIL